MPIKNLTDEQYDNILWEKVWEIASKRVTGKKLKTNILNQLSIDTGIEVLTFWRHLRKKNSLWRAGTRELLLKYIGGKTNEEFRKEIDFEIENKGEVYWKMMDSAIENPALERVYSALSESPLITNNDQFSVEDANLFSHFIGSLHIAYTGESLFNSLTIVADKGSAIGRISMSDYFIQLSYVTTSEIATRSSLVRSETELNALKIRRSIENNQQLTKDYVVNFSLQNIQNLLVLGNPGVGKSTFCRWLCHEWSQNPQTTNNVTPVYVQLKGLEFNNTDNSIVSYIRRHYLMKYENSDVHNLLQNVHPFVCFVLDGFDELADNQKGLMLHHLNEISSNCKYILASRPYGLLKTNNLKHDQLIQLDGFDTANVHNYIDVFMQKNAKARGKGKEQLLEIINFNPTLTDFAHNPLMLSFIVYIYISDDNADEILRKIQTRFDLQQVVVSWMFIHNRSKVSVPFDDTLTDAISKIANGMEFGKTAERTGYLSDTEYDAVLLPVSELGIGQLTENSPGKYKFYFNSITFQEYFASISIAGSITSAALEYILQDSYFWNLAAMVLGQISSKTTLSIMDNLLAACEEELLKEESEYSYYKYLLLLSECRIEYLNSKLNHSILQTINKAFAQNIQKSKDKDNKNEHLKYAFAECLQRIYSKMNDTHKRSFKGILLNEMDSSWRHPNDPILKWDASCKHLPILVKYLDLNSDIGFTTRCLELLISALEEYHAKDLDFSVLWDMPDFVVAILQNNPESFFLITRAHMEKVQLLLPESFLHFKGRIELHFTNANQALMRLTEKIHQYNAADTKDAKGKLIGLIAIYSFVLGRKKYAFDDERNIAESQHQLLAAAKIIYNHLRGMDRNYSPEYIDGPRPITQLTTEGLLESNNYTEAIDILATIDDEYLFFDQMIQTNLHNYFDEIVTNTASYTDEPNLIRICTMIYCIPALKNKIAFHRNKIGTLINDYINNNKNVFKETKPISVVDYFLRLLERGEEDVYENDRRFFIGLLLAESAETLPFFRKTLFPRVIRKHIIIYNAEYWDFILSFLNENDEGDIRAGITMFMNPSIYQYTTNVPYIHQLFTFLLQLRSRPFYETFIKSQAENILAIIGNALMMLRQANVTPQLVLSNILPFTGELLRQDALQTEITENPGKTRQSAACNAAYILQYYFDQDTSFDLKINYWQFLQKANQKQMLIEYLYPAFVYRGILPGQELNKIESVTGKEFITELQSQHDRMKIHQFPFEKEEFLKLCS